MCHRLTSTWIVTCVRRRTTRHRAHTLTMTFLYMGVCVTTRTIFFIKNLNTTPLVPRCVAPVGTPSTLHVCWAFVSAQTSLRSFLLTHCPDGSNFAMLVLAYSLSLRVYAKSRRSNAQAESNPVNFILLSLRACEAIQSIIPITVHGDGVATYRPGLLRVFAGGRRATVLTHSQ